MTLDQKLNARKTLNQMQIELSAMQHKLSHINDQSNEALIQIKLVGITSAIKEAYTDIFEVLDELKK